MLLQYSGVLLIRHSCWTVVGFHNDAQGSATNTKFATSPFGFNGFTSLQAFTLWWFGGLVTLRYCSTNTVRYNNCVAVQYARISHVLYGSTMSKSNYCRTSTVYSKYSSTTVEVCVLGRSEYR